MQTKQYVAKRVTFKLEVDAEDFKCFKANCAWGDQSMKMQLEQYIADRAERWRNSPLNPELSDAERAALLEADHVAK
jgi:hypothetical protein